MNVYDFDGTILEGDSEAHFFNYVLDNKLINCFRRARFRYLWSLEKKKKVHWMQTRKAMYKLLKPIKNLEIVLEYFWDYHMNDIKDFYYDLHKDDDVISSATPRFILEPIIKRLKVKYLIATEFDLETFEIIEPFNYKEQKVITFRKLFGNKNIENFYSDSENDRFLALEAKNAYKVTGDKIEKWVL